MSREQSVEVIHLDVLRTFPTLGFFQEVGSVGEESEGGGGRRRRRGRREVRGHVTVQHRKGEGGGSVELE